ncbi:MAG: hypothetical protein IT260_03080 [Saprospiraceae bacterium]|nr:hypothetical protein [Saprospiraceae bacterium]
MIQGSNPKHPPGRHSKLQSCKNGSSLNDRSLEYPVIDTIELRFLAAVKTDADVVLELFNIQESLQVAGELQWAERWAKKINARLAH